MTGVFGAPDVVPAAYTVRVEASGDLHHMCPFKSEPDRGEVTIGWTCAGGTFELHSLAAYLETFEEMEISHEELIARVALELQATAAGRVTDITVAGFYDTAELNVKVMTLPTAQ